MANNLRVGQIRFEFRTTLTCRKCTSTQNRDFSFVHSNVIETSTRNHKIDPQSRGLDTDQDLSRANSDPAILLSSLPDLRPAIGAISSGAEGVMTQNAPAARFAKSNRTVMRSTEDHHNRQKQRQKDHGHANQNENTEHTDAMNDDERDQKSAFAIDSPIPSEESPNRQIDQDEDKDHDENDDADRRFRIHRQHVSFAFESELANRTRSSPTPAAGFMPCRS